MTQMEALKLVASLAADKVIDLKEEKLLREALAQPEHEWRADVQKVRDALDPDDWCGDERMIDVLDRALAQPKEPEQEPVAWGADQAYAEGRGDYEVAQIRAKKTGWKLFGELSPKEQAYWVAKAAFDRATPPQRKPLTDEQREEIAKGWRGRNWTLGDIIDAVEDALGIKGDA